MAVEAPDISSADVSVKPPIDFGEWRNRHQLDDEFNNTSVATLKPLKSVKILVGPHEEDFDSSIQKDFAYYSRTRDLEVNTPRAQLLQNLVDRMTVGTDIQARVVIMNKGREYSAFITPDETVFISQSILNGLGSIDEIGAVLAHEVGHLYLKTFERNVKARGSRGSVAIPWLHEGVSDSLAKEFGEKAGLNTFAFGTAIEKISGPNRGFEHQGGYMRSSQNVAEHYARHYDTSAKPVEPAPIMLLKKVRPTNLEVVGEKIANRQSGRFRKDLVKLHPRDLEQAYAECLGRAANDETDGYEPQHYLQSLQMLDNFNQLLSSRLQDRFSSKEILAWFTAVDQQNRYLLKNSADVTGVCEVIAEATNADSQLFERMSQTVFEEGPYIDDAMGSFLDILEKYLYDESTGPVKGKVPVNRQTILEILGKLKVADSRNTRKHRIGRVLEAYTEEVFYKNATESDNEIDTAQIVEFLDEAKEMVILDDWISSGILGRADNRLSDFKKKFEEDSINVQNYQKMSDTFKSYFGRKDWEPFADINKEIDAFCQNFSSKETYHKWAGQISGFLGDLRKTFDHQNLTDAERDRFIRYLSDKFDDWPALTEYSVRKSLEHERKALDIGDPFGIGDPAENARLARLQIRTAVGLVLFKQDGEEFYKFLEETAVRSGIDFSSFSKVGLVNLYSLLFLVIERGRTLSNFNVVGVSINVNSVPVDIKNFERLAKLSIMSEILNRDEQADLSSWEKLKTSAFKLADRLDVDTLGACGFPTARGEKDYDIFSDRILTLILFQNHRQAFLDLLDKGVKEEDLSSLYDTLTAIFPADRNRDNFLRAIQKRYLQSGQVTLDDKIRYLLTNLESLGPEGVFMVGDQITSLADYQNFRERLGDKLEGYLNGDPLLLKGLAADLITSLLSGGFRKVIQTTIAGLPAGGESSTEFAEAWFWANFNLRSVINRARYEPEKKKFVTGEDSRPVFRSIADIFTMLHNFTHTQRFLILRKALADTDGALSTPRNRQELAGLVTRALKLKSGFVHDVMKAACLIGAPSLITVSAANMLAPMLFRSLDVERIDTNKLSALQLGDWNLETGEYRYFPLSDVLAIEDIARIVSSTTRELTIFGAKFIHQPDSYFYSAVQQSDRAYQHISDSLEKQLLVETENQMETAGGVDPAVEAIVKGVEASGALGTRSLQLATQLLTFSPEVTKRLSQSFDANPGMRKLIFWERLYQLSRKDPALLSLLSSTTILDYKGGGSLFTTYAAKKIDPATGSQRDIVVKVLNTNAAGLMEQYYSMAVKVLADVEKKQGRSDFSKAARLLVDISRQWCREDIRDESFAIDDDKFQETIRSFNAAAGREIFYAPKREFFNMDVKVEDLAEGPTLNKFLNSDKVSFEQKKNMVESLMRFFAFQFQHILRNQPGEEFYQFHSDPHVGNYIITNGEANPKLAVIDRSMYLKLKKEEVEILESLVRGTDNTSFVNRFVGRVLDINSVTSNLQRKAVWFRVWSALGRELGSQTIRGKADNFSLLRTMFTELDKAGCKVPLNLRLMVRNIGAFKELGGKFGLKLEDYV